MLLSENGAGHSRRKVLQTMGASGATVFGATNLSGRVSASSPTEVTELSLSDGMQPLVSMVNREDFAQIEYELVEELGARRQINDSSIHKIIEHNGEARYVVSVPYTIREDDEEVFIQYNGLDSLSEDAKTELDEDIPTVIGYHSIQSPEIEVQANVSIDWSSVDMYPVDEGEVTVHSGDDSTNSIEISNLPGDDDCACYKQVATDCAPSLSCIADIAGAFALATGACGACYLDPEPVTKGLACSAGIGTILTQYDSPSCLGREDTTNRCIPETHPDSDVICG